MPALPVMCVLRMCRVPASGWVPPDAVLRCLLFGGLTGCLQRPRLATSSRFWIWTEMEWWVASRLLHILLPELRSAGLPCYPLLSVQHPVCLHLHLGATCPLALADACCAAASLNQRLPSPIPTPTLQISAAELSSAMTFLREQMGEEELRHLLEMLSVEAGASAGQRQQQQRGSEGAAQAVRAAMQGTASEQSSPPACCHASNCRLLAALACRQGRRHRREPAHGVG